MKILILNILLFFAFNIAFAQNKKIINTLKSINQNQEFKENVNGLKANNKYKRKCSKDVYSYIQLDSCLNSLQNLRKIEATYIGKLPMYKIDNILKNRYSLIEQINRTYLSCNNAKKRKDKKRFKKWNLCGILGEQVNKELFYIKNIEKVKDSIQSKVIKSLEGTIDKKDIIFSEYKIEDDKLLEKKKNLPKEAVDKLSNLFQDLADSFPCLFRIATIADENGAHIEILFGDSAKRKFVDANEYQIDTSKCDANLYDGKSSSYGYGLGEFYPTTYNSKATGRFLYSLLTILDTSKFRGQNMFKVAHTYISIDGGSDGTIMERKLYNEELGDTIQTSYKYFMNGLYIDSTKIMLIKNTIIDNKTLAFLRAYHVYYSYLEQVKTLNIRLSSFYKIIPKFSVFESTNIKNPSDRFCRIVIDLNGAFNEILDNIQIERQILKDEMEAQQKEISRNAKKEYQNR